MKIEQEHWDRAGEFVRLADCIIGGSILVDPDNANDIDIIISADKWAVFVREYGPEKFGFVQSDLENDDTYEVEIYELVSVWNSGKVNVLVYNPDFIPAIKAACRDMKRDPDSYKTRELRIELHNKYKQRIRNMIDNDYWDEAEDA